MFGSTPHPLATMATASILYPPEKTNHLVTPAEPRKISKQTAARMSFAPDANIRATLRDLTDIARDLPMEEALSLEIEKLCSATLIIDETFYDIGRRLSNAVNEQNKRVDVYDACCALEAQWNEHHITYQHLLWRSRETAGKAQGTIDDFREVVFPLLRDPDTTRSEKQEIIQEQIQELQDTSNPSRKLCQEFLDFGRALDKYITDFSRVVEGLGISEKSQMVAGLENSLRCARAAMEAVSREVKELGWKFAEDVAFTGIALLLAFMVPKLCAELADATAVSTDCMKVKNSGFQLLDVRRRRDLAVKEYEAIKAEYDLERACLGQMVKLEYTLHNATPLVQEVTLRLGIFASVWAAITADIQNLKNSLHCAADPTSKLFIHRVKRLEKMYGHLSQALRHYQVTVQLT